MNRNPARQALVQHCIKRWGNLALPSHQHLLIWPTCQICRLHKVAPKNILCWMSERLPFCHLHRQCERPLRCHHHCQIRRLYLMSTCIASSLLRPLLHSPQAQKLLLLCSHRWGQQRCSPCSLDDEACQETQLLKSMKKVEMRISKDPV